MTPEEFWAVLQAPVEVKPIFFRLYHNDDGTLLCYSMEDLPHNYIEIDATTYNLRLSNVQVVNKKIVKINPASYVKQLVPGNEGTPCHPNDVCIVIEESKPHTKWSVKTNETS